MEDKLVTLAILTYAKAQILKSVLENEGIETYNSQCKPDTTGCFFWRTCTYQGE